MKVDFSRGRFSRLGSQLEISMTSGMVFRCEMLHFSRSSRSSGLSAIFRSPRWRRVLCHRGLPCQLSSALRTDTLSTSLSACQKQQQQHSEPSLVGYCFAAVKTAEGKGFVVGLLFLGTMVCPSAILVPGYYSIVRDNKNSEFSMQASSNMADLGIPAGPA